MTTTLTKLPGSKWWVETDDATNQIVATFNKEDIKSQIATLQTTLASYPSPTQDATDVADLMVAIAGKWTPAKNTRIVGLINTMFTVRQGNADYSEITRITALISTLQATLARLV
jgi:hypothetical protein